VPLMKKSTAPTKKAAPTKAVAKKAAGVTKKAAPKRTTDDDDYDDDVQVTSGWGGADKLRDAQTPWATNLKLKDGETVLIWFPQDEPYANVATHWVKRSGRQSFVCLGKSCPLCGIGDRPRVTNNFNVVKFTDDEPMIYTLATTTRLYNKVKAKAQDARYGPLSKRPYSYGRTGSGRDDTEYSLDVVKRDGDIEEEFPGINYDRDAAAKLPLSTKEDALKERVSMKEMQELARELSDDYEAEDDD